MKLTPDIRGFDSQGAGYYGAPRGKRKHAGIDFICEAGEKIPSFTDGVVQKIGYPYPPTGSKGHFRYVEVLFSGERRVRYFYLEPKVKVGQMVKKGDILGISQDLTETYPGITQHLHFEIKSLRNTALNPHKFLLKVL